jgi:putative SOS response-associated peptidase YedK
MCGRFQIALPGQTLATLLDAEYAAGSVQPTWNAAPGQVHPVLALGAEGRVLESLEWGLVPAWAAARPAGAPLINARAETVVERASFRDAVRSGRVLVPVTGFYEWAGTRGTKVPHSIRVRGLTVDPATGERSAGFATRGDVVEPFLLAGIRDERTGTFAVLTTTPNELCVPIHDRMPVILEGDDAQAWMAAPPSDTVALVAELARPFPAERMEAWPVSREVNDAAADGPRLVAEAAGDPQQSLL